MEKKLSFAIRMKTYRYVTVLGGNPEFVGKSLKVGELPDGEYSITFKKPLETMFPLRQDTPGIQDTDPYSFERV